jgi:hypothetical protein
VEPFDAVQVAIQVVTVRAAVAAVVQLAVEEPNDRLDRAFSKVSVTALTSPSTSAAATRSSRVEQPSQLRAPARPAAPTTHASAAPRRLMRSRCLPRLPARHSGGC